MWDLRVGGPQIRSNGKDLATKVGRGTRCYEGPFLTFIVHDTGIHRDPRSVGGTPELRETALREPGEF